MLSARAFRQAQSGIFGVAGSSRRRRGLGTLEPPCAPPWRSETERGRARMSLLTWTVSDGGVHHADFGRGRYSVAKTHGRVPRFVARWHRSRGPFTEGKNSTGAADHRSRQGCLRAARGTADRRSLGAKRRRWRAYARRLASWRNHCQPRPLIAERALPPQVQGRSQAA